MSASQEFAELYRVHIGPEATVDAVAANTLTMVVFEKLSKDEVNVLYTVMNDEELKGSFIRVLKLLGRATTL